MVSNVIISGFKQSDIYPFNATKKSSDVTKKSTNVTKKSSNAKVKETFKSMKH